MNPSTQRTFDNPDFGSVRTLETHDGKILFCAFDVAKALGYAKPNNAIKAHCRYALKQGIPHPQNINKIINMIFIPESDIYRLITHSKLPNAEKFESWLFDEVLPILRANKLFMKDPTEWVKHLTNRQDCGRIENKNKRSFEWYENISALALGDTSINTYAKALDLADYSITQLSALVKYLLHKNPRNEEFIMKHAEINLDELKSYLPQYVTEWTEKRKYGKYNCPFCGSGTGANGTPAFGLYENNTKFKCQSCGIQGTIIDFYLTIHEMSNTQENVSQAIKALSEEFHLTPNATSAISPRKPNTPKVKIDERRHIYKNADGSIFGKKIVNKFSDGSKNAQWILFNPQTGTFNNSYGLDGQKAPLYNADLLQSNQDEPVYIVEGEKDADTLTNWEAVATTFPNGAGFTQWIPLYNEGLKDREVIILTDNDNSGRKYGNTIARNLLNIAKSVKIVPATTIWDKCPEKGDITDIAQAIGEEETQEFLISAIQRTSFCTPESLPKINESPTIHQQEIEYPVIRLSEVKFEKQEFLWNPYLPIGEITVMYAAGGTGKSYATIGIAADITTGRSLPRYGIEQVMVNPEKVLFISAEDNESIILSRMREAGGNPDNCFVLKTPKTRKDLKTDSFLLPQNKDDTIRIQAFAKLLEKVHPKLVVIDPWSVYIGDDKNMNKANDVRGVTNVLTVLAKEYNCAILIVAHVNKMPQTENANNAVSGSTALIDSARSALCIRSFGADSDRRVIIQTKSNYQKKAKSVCYQIINQGEHRTAKFEWDGFSDLTEDDLTKSARTGKSLSDIENDNSDDDENKKDAIEIINDLAVLGQSVNISYVRFRQEIVDKYGEDFLPKRPQKFMNSLASDLRACGISLELKKAVKGLLPNGEHDTISRIGFTINKMTDGHLMASAMPKQ